MAQQFRFGVWNFVLHLHPIGQPLRLSWGTQIAMLFQPQHQHIPIPGKKTCKHVGQPGHRPKHVFVRDPPWLPVSCASYHSYRNFQRDRESWIKGLNHILPIPVKTGGPLRKGFEADGYKPMTSTQLGPAKVFLRVAIWSAYCMYCTFLPFIVSANNLLAAALPWNHINLAIQQTAYSHTSLHTAGKSDCQPNQKYTNLRSSTSLVSPTPKCFRIP